MEYRKLLNFEAEPATQEICHRYTCADRVNLYISTEQRVVLELVANEGQKYLVRVIPVDPFVYGHIDMGKFAGSFLENTRKGWFTNPVTIFDF